MKKNILEKIGFKNMSLAAFLAFIVIGFFCQSFSIRQSSDSMGVVDAALIPRLIVGLTALTGSLCLILDAGKGQEKGPVSDGKKTAGSVLIMFAAVMLLELLGFLIMGVFFLAGQILLMCDEKPDKQKIVRTLLLSAVCTAAFVVIFRYGFGIGIPVLPFS